MNAVPLESPDGVIRAWFCETCLRMPSPHSYLTDEPLTTEQIKDIAASSRRSADICCRCRKCDGPKPRRAWGHEDGRPYEWCDDCWETHGEEHRAEMAARKAEWQRKDALEEFSYTQAKDYNAAKRLRERMSDLSEEHYFAGWLSGLEFTLWDFLSSQPSDKWGMREVSKGALAELRELSEDAGGWVTFEGFVKMPEWVKRVELKAQEAGES